jgi:hypothetical protein
MASSPSLHPSVRTRQQPRISATGLAEYLILRPGGQQNILHDSKYSRPPIVTANGEAMRALRAYNQDPKRSKDTLLRVKAALRMKAAGLDIKPKAKDEALRCVEIIELFEWQENALGMRAMALSEPPDFDMIEIEGVMVSIQPDFLVTGAGGRVGAAMLRVAKAPDPAACKTEEAKDRRGNTRRELARYLIAEMQLLLEAQRGQLGIPDPELCFVADVRLGERIGPAADQAVRLRDIRGACQQIAKLWPTIKPKPALFKGR